MSRRLRGSSRPDVNGMPACSEPDRHAEAGLPGADDDHRKLGAVPGDRKGQHIAMEASRPSEPISSSIIGTYSLGDSRRRPSRIIIAHEQCPVDRIGLRAAVVPVVADDVKGQAAGGGLGLLGHEPCTVEEDAGRSQGPVEISRRIASSSVICTHDSSNAQAPIRRCSAVAISSSESVKGLAGVRVAHHPAGYCGWAGAELSAQPSHCTRRRGTGPSANRPPAAPPSPGRYPHPGCRL